jgi:hypothetical protein
MKWTNKDMLEFARVASEGAYGNYRGCKTLISKLNKYKELNEMSRYVKELEDGNYISYGFDNALGYFFDLCTASDEDGDSELLIEESSILSGMNNGKMIGLMSIFKLPESHIEMVAMDVPIV